MRVFQWVVTSLFLLVSVVPFLMLVSDLAKSGEPWDGFGVLAGLMILTVIGSMAVPLILSWVLPRIQDGTRAILALSSSAMLLLAAIVVMLHLSS